MTWIWDAEKLRWTCTLKDGAILRVTKRKDGQWVAEAEDKVRVHRSHRVHANADLGQDEAMILLQELVRWRSTR